MVYNIVAAPAPPRIAVTIYDMMRRIVFQVLFIMIAIYVVVEMVKVSRGVPC